jgi:hypothetical protein
MYFLPRAATAKDCAKRARNCEHIRVLVCLSVSLDYYFKCHGWNHRLWIIVHFVRTRLAVVVTEKTWSATYRNGAGRPFSAKKVFPSVHALFANDVICWATT